MKLAKAPAILVLCIFAVFPLFAQSTETSEGRQLTIEELFLSQDIEVQIMRSQALSNERESKLLALQTIRNVIASGRAAGNESAVIAILDSLAGEGVYRVVRQGGTVINYFPEVRRQAANLLGEIGGDAAKTILLKMISDDPEPMVLSEAAFAIGTIGINEPAVTTTMIAALRRNTFKVVPDNNFAYATLLALEALADDGPGIANPEVLQGLIEVVSGNYIEVVKLKALEIISNLRN